MSDHFTHSRPSSVHVSYSDHNEELNLKDEIRNLKKNW